MPTQLAPKKRRYADELAFRRTIARILALIMLGLLLSASILAWHEGSRELLPGLLSALLAPLAALCWLRIKPGAAMFPLFLLTGSLMALGAYLLLIRGAPQGSSLIWFVIFPSMAMFCLGLRYGTLVSGLFYLFLSTVMLSPLSAMMVDQLSMTVRYRFLLAMLGAFVFAWCAEYIRHETRQALIRLAMQMEQQALTDPLTGLGNRREFESHFLWAAASSKREGKDISLALIDVDYFKRVNDTYGHAAGDKVLAHLAQLLSSRTRASDRLFRWGGEEFVILMPSTELDKARLAAESLRALVESTPYTEGRLILPCTVSMGLYGGEARDLKECMAEADRNLYLAKGSGRNKVVG